MFLFRFILLLKNANDLQSLFSVSCHFEKDCWIDLLIDSSFDWLADINHVVSAILYLLSDEADMIHGTSLAVDGGLLAV